LTELAALEEQYGLLCADFYHCFRARELEKTRDFIRWAGYYEAKQETEASQPATQPAASPQSPPAPTVETPAEPTAQAA
jgi:hypothetical protein